MVIGMGGAMVLPIFFYIPMHEVVPKVVAMVVFYREGDFIKYKGE